MGASLIRSAGAVLLVTLILGVHRPVSARPEYLARFQSDPFRRAEVDGCGACHVNTDGGGARNDFGNAFEAASREITPMLRASFPRYFKFDTVKLADGATLSFSDPRSRVVVVERQDQRIAADLAALTAERTAPLPPPANRMGFFVTSQGLESAGRLGGLAGADRHCQNLAKAVGADERTWRAYLSTSFQGKPAVHAGDRIGSGPWFNANGMLLARGPADLHGKERFRPEVVLTEKGDAVAPDGDAAAAQVVIVTGSLANGSAAVGENCNNWTSDADGEAIVGDLAKSWNSATTVSCSEKSSWDAARKILLYCFAAK